MVVARPRALQLGEDEGLEQLQRHLLRQAALVQPQRRTDHDHRTTGVVDALAEQVLTEPALLALDHVGERLQRALVGAGDGAAATAVVHQRIDRFLQHALLVAHDDVGRIEFEQTLQAVVAVDHATVQIVQIGGRETTAVQRHQRTQVRRQHRQHGHHHPFRLVAGFDERLDQLDALGQALELGLGIGGGDLFLQADHFAVQVERTQQLVDGFGAHARVELVAVLLGRVEVLIFVEQLAALERGHARIDHHEGFEVQDALDVAQRHVQHQADARRQRLQEPDVRGRAGQLDVAHALATHLGQRDFRAALLADHATMLHALVLAAQALVVLHRTEDGGAEQAVTLRLEGAVVDRLRLLHFAVRPRTDQLRRRQRDLDRVEVRRRALLVEQIEKSFIANISGDRARDRTLISSRSMSMASERISLTSTLKDSGMPAAISWFAVDDVLVHLVAALHVVGLHREHFLQGVSRAVGFQRPDFHFAEALTAELRLAAQRLLGDQRVRTGGTRVHLVVDQMVELEHVHVADGDRAIERLAGAAVDTAWSDRIPADPPASASP